MSAEPTVVVVTSPGPQGRPGSGATSGSLSAPVSVLGVLTVTVTSNWGIDSGGNPYYDPAGAASADAAIASLNSTGALVLTKPS